MPRILLLIKGLGRGGAEQLLVNATRHLDREQFDYEAAYVLPWKDQLVPGLGRAGIEAVCLEGGRGPGWVARLRRHVRSRGIDLVHVHSPYAAVGARLALPRSIPLVYTEHNVWTRYHPVTYWSNVLTYPRNDRVLAVSNHVRASIAYPRALRRRPMPPTETLYHGLDLDAVPSWTSANGVREELGIPEGAPIVGTVGNFKAHKGHEYLLRAAVYVRRELPDARFVLVGQGPLEQQVRQTAHELGLDGSVVFTGAREDAPRLAAAFDVFTIASIHEGLSVALLEAMVSGRPSVVTDVGGVPELIRHGYEGLVVPPKDPESLAAGIMTLLRDPGLRLSLGDLARERAVKFDIRRAIRRTEEIYRELLEAP